MGPVCLLSYRAGLKSQSVRAWSQIVRSSTCSTKNIVTVSYVSWEIRNYCTVYAVLSGVIAPQPANQVSIQSADRERSSTAHNTVDMHVLRISYIIWRPRVSIRRYCDGNAPTSYIDNTRYPPSARLAFCAVHGFPVRLSFCSASYLLTCLFAHSLTYVLNHSLLTYLLNYLLRCCLPAYLFLVYLITYLFSYLLIWLVV